MSRELPSITPSRSGAWLRAGLLCTYAVVPGVQEIEELLGALLLRLGPGGHPGVAQLQPLPRLGALLRLLAVLPQGGQGVLGDTQGLC